jgi:vacuolar-type H+-ATPase catalytic subunit A/Vma1
MNLNPEVEKYRIKNGPYESACSQMCGAFIVPGPFGRDLTVIASDGMGWDHVSVSISTRCPNWPEMCLVKDLFFGPEETVIQFHPPKSEYVNNHSGCLHLWRKQGFEFPLPPGILVGIKELGEIT